MRENNRYHYYRGLIKEIYNNEVELTVEEIEEEVYKAYQDDLLTAHEYDSLCILISEL